MAKLSARGRKEVYRIVKKNADDADTTNNKTFLALMSDRKILMKRTHDWKVGSSGASLYGGSNHYSSAWNVYGKLKPGVTPEQWLYNKLNAVLGWEQVPTRS